jgi:hypothetical protein
MGPTFFFITALGGLLFLLAALFADRSRGRQRCPKCNYRIETKSPTDGSPWRCSECGRQIESIRQLRRTRRHWRWALVGLTIFLAAWAYPKREEFKRHGAWAAVPTIATLPFLGVLDDHWRPTPFNPDGGPLAPLSEVVLQRAWGDQLSWPDWQLLLLRIRISPKERLFAEPEKHSGQSVTLFSSILETAYEQDRLSASRIKKLDSLTHIEIDPVAPWVAGEPLPARVHLRSWKLRTIEITIANASDPSETIRLQEVGPSGVEGAAPLSYSTNYTTWTDRFVELPAPDADGSIELAVTLKETEHPLSSLFAPEQDEPQNQESEEELQTELFMEVTQRLQIPLLPAPSLAPLQSEDSVLNEAIAALTPSLVLMDADPLTRDVHLELPNDPLYWIDVPDTPIQMALQDNTSTVLALRSELWRDEDLLGHASAWWAASTIVWPTGKAYTDVQPSAWPHEYHCILFRPAVAPAQLGSVDVSDCRWRITADSLMLRRCLSWRQYHELSDHWTNDWTHYWDGEVVIDGHVEP